MLPLLPTLLEQRIGTNPELTQRYTSIFLAEGAFVSVISSPIFGSLADAVSSKRTLLMILLGLTLIGVAFLALTTQCMSCPSCHGMIEIYVCRKLNGQTRSGMVFRRSVLPMYHKQRPLDSRNGYNG